MKILIAADTYAPDVNGASYFAQRLAAGLATDHEVHVIAPSRTARSSSSTGAGGITEHRVRSLPVVLSRGFRFCPPVGLGSHVRSVLRSVRPDVVHVQSHFLVGRAVLHAAREMGIPVVATNHFMPENLLHYVPGGAAVRRRAHGWAWQDAAGVLALADVVTSPTPFAAALAESAGVPGPVLPISCGLDLDRFSSARDGARFRRKYGLPSGPVLASVGRLDPEKNVHEFIEALALVRAHRDVHLLVVGDGAERPRLEALAAERGVADSVTFTGVLDDAELPEAYAAADFFGIAGTAELQSLVTLEAMATGLPVLGVDAGALPHLVQHGRTGWLYPHGDVEELAGRLAALLEDPESARRMGRNAGAVAAGHDLGATLEAFLGLYEACLGSRTEWRPRRDALTPA
ncbi:glycosyltransferase [Phycicoccus sp. CSK15P-2]|uniref:glycosyltransferase n=1 Tax=Phycicoccus sp. CSK15P-2 TaxID=2807627 RepID=UPI001950ED4C|nr:glycosyltransferase [Phycicoccus sp. CSK15P-2]MBM6402967.1 glycosyltransferase [Phycicoccus sp. CSK15P-2]